MSLTAKQDDWSNLLFIDSISKPPVAEDMFENLSSNDRLELAATWVSDGIHARHTDYPKTSQEIKYFKLSRSAKLRALFNVAVIIQLLSTFLDNRSCDHDYSHPHYTLFHPNGAPTRLLLTVLDLVFLVLYSWDLFLNFAVNPSRKSLLAKPWSTLRLLICVFVLLDCIFYFADPSQPRLMRSVFPFLLISKRNNLKLMCQGLMVSAYKSLPIIKALVSILVLWGFFGFVFFRTTDTEDLAFANPGEGIAEALHCFTSRPYVLKSLDTIYSENQASALYYVSLTLAADVLCIALIVATGAKHYKQFAGNILHNRLVDRRHAIECAFRCVAEKQTDDEAHKFARSAASSIDSADTSTTFKSARIVDEDEGMVITRQTWVALCDHISGKFSPTPHTANFIFDLVINADPRNDEDEENRDLKGDDDEDANGTEVVQVPRRFEHSMDKFLFFRCCALVAARIVVQVEVPVGDPQDPALRDRASSMNLARETACEDFDRTVPLTVFSPSPECSGKDHGDGTEERDSGEQKYDVTMVTAQFGTRGDRLSNFKVMRVSEHVSAVPPIRPVKRLSEPRVLRPSKFNSTVTSVEKSVIKFVDDTYNYLQPVRQVCVHITGANVTVYGVSGVYTLNIFYCINIFLLLLLLIDICYLSQAKKVWSWYIFACFLEVLFWAHLSVRILAVGVRRFISFYENRADSLFNFFSLVALIELGKTYASSSYSYSGNTPMGWYLLIQAFRLFKLFFAVNDVKVFEHMRPVLIRASFIYFSIVYFFSIFAYSYFCNSMNIEDANSTSSSSDANQWPQYSNLLNFNTLLQSLFTLFEISILGNWSIVMDAAVASTNKPASAYIFFYTYRLVITLFILPILVSFIIQVFLSALSLREKELKDEEEKKRAIGDMNLDDEEDRFSLGEMGIFTENPYAENSAVPAGSGKPSNKSKRVSYNVNQEVVTLARRSSAVPAFGDDGEEGEDSAEKKPKDSDQDGTELQDTINPMSAEQEAAAAADRAKARESHRLNARTSAANNPSSHTPAARRKSAWAIKLDVDTINASNARDKNSEVLPSVTRPEVGHLFRPSEGASSTHTASVDKEGGLDRQTGQSSLSPVRNSGRHARESGAPGGDGKSKVTVQYDSKGGSSMMSIWTIEGNDPTKGGGSKKNGQGSPTPGTPIGGNNSEAKQLARLQAKLDAALHQLDVEKTRNKALREQANLM